MIPQADTPPSQESLPTRFSALLRDLARVPEGEITAWERALRPGAVIGRFELVRQVGRGGFGVVYEARDVDLGRNVAFKAVLPGSEGTVREERLLREAEAVARLSHPNIVTLYDVGRSEHGPYLVLELLRGQTLARRLEQGPLPPPEALRIAVEVAKGIAHAHANGVVHRDLSPGNVFLCEDGQVKVLDLGLAHAFGRRRVEGGTPGYMAPEQRRSAPEDERTDVFSLGVILYRMLANELPYAEPIDPAEVPAPVLDIPGLPKLGDALASMLEGDPVRRPRDAGVVVAQLTPLLYELERTPSTGKPLAVRRRRRRAARVAIAFAAMGLVAGTSAAAALKWGAPDRWFGRTPRGAPPSIAVLPFADLSPDKDREYFSEGLADEILTALSRVDGLRVPGRTSSFFFKNKNAKLADIGRELNVQAVLEGSVRLVGNHVRVTAQIVGVNDGYPMWGQTYDRELTDVFEVQDEIARSVVEAMHVQLLGAPPKNLHGTSNPDVYAQYLLGRDQYHRLTQDSLRLAVEAYERAIALEPGYAPAWAGIGLPLYLTAGSAGSPAAAVAQRRRALAAAEKAVALAPELPDALSTRGFLRAAVQNDLGGAKQDLERALSLNRNDADARRRYAVLLQDLGKLPEAIAEARRAVDLDPLGQSQGTLGALLEMAGRYEEAEATFRRYLQVSPGNSAATLSLARTLLLRSQPAAALEIFAQIPYEAQRLWGTALAEHSLRHAAQAEAALDALVERHGAEDALEVAEVYAWRGDKEEAFRWLGRAVADTGSIGGRLRWNPFFRGLRDDPRYAALLRDLKLPPP